MAISKLSSQYLNHQLMLDSSTLCTDSDLSTTSSLTQQTPHKTEAHHGSTQGSTTGVWIQLGKEEGPVKCK